jgi:hypothetical protein
MATAECRKWCRKETHGNWSDNRLTVIGARRQVHRFQQSTWATALGANHCELLENSPGRFSCQFDTEDPPLESLKRLSRRWPGLVLLLDHEEERQRIKGLAKAQKGQMAHCQFDF